MQIIQDIAMAGGIAVITAALALWGVGAVRLRHGSGPVTAADPDPVTLLFDRGILHHATRAAMSTLDLQPGLHDWDDLRAALHAQFPDFPQMAEGGARVERTLHATGGDQASQVRLRWRDDLCWVSVTPGPTNCDAPQTPQRSVGHGDQAMMASPHPAWAVDDSGSVLWQNRAHDALMRRSDPLVGGTASLTQAAELATAEPVRVMIEAPGADADVTAEWYEVSGMRVGDITHFNATCVTALHQAEEAKRMFVQTLSKTFAHLPIGLAIFDRDSRLALFNPALVDLTGLSAVFLSGRPTMISFFDQLREHRRMPEPKNYANWREEIADVIAAASDGRYQETWSLEGGQTFSVQGRPHPDGATAFLIEDISAEVLLTRNFRAELELGQALFDSFDEALVVFSPAGVLTFSNDAYRRMWDQNPDGAFADVTITDAISAWQDKAAPTAPWPEIAEFVTGAAHYTAREIALPLRNGTVLRCRMNAITTGARLIRFDNGPMAPTALPRPLAVAGE